MAWGRPTPRSVGLDSFARAQKLHLGGLTRNCHHRKGMLLLLSAGLLGRVNVWERCLNHSYPGLKPADWDRQIAAMRKNLGEPARMKAPRAMGRSAPTDAGAYLARARCRC